MIVDPPMLLVVNDEDEIEMIDVKKVFKYKNQVIKENLSKNQTPVVEMETEAKKRK